MPTFTPPTVEQGSSDPFFGRYSIPVGQSVISRNGTFQTVPFPTLMEIDGLIEGEDWFQGGRTYVVSEDVATALALAGYEVAGDEGFGVGPYGAGGFGY